MNIPKDFYSDSDGKPFLQCKVCEKHLIESGEPYVIEKGRRKQAEGDDLTIFEMAICISCAQKQAAKMSKASRKTIESVMLNQKTIDKRSDLWDNDWESNWKNNCLVSDNSVKENEEYNIAGHFIGNEVLHGQPPFIISSEILEWLQENLSPETKEELDNFGRQFLGPDPTIKMLLEEYQFVMV